MTRILKPIYEEDGIFELSSLRFMTMFRPLQKTSYKKSDFVSYLANPLVDLALAPCHTLNAAIHLLNAAASLINTIFIWTINQQQTNDLFDDDTKREFKTAFNYTFQALSALVSKTLNLIFSLASLVTRPVASLVSLCVNGSNDEYPTQYQQHPESKDEGYSSWANSQYAGHYN